MRVILASTSPRRRELLTLLGLPFDVQAPAFNEQITPGLSVMDLALEFARGKARAVARYASGAAVIGSDTLIEIDEEAVGKPETIADARAMLRRLMGREHRIVSAVAVCLSDRRFEEAALSTVRVWMKAFDDADLERYLASQESIGKAGAYAIQGFGCRLIDRIEGDFTAAVGLPLRETAGLLGKCGLSVPTDLRQLYRSRPYPNWSRFA
ncbi:MAG: Maf family protein [Nitrospiraceae bacterium]